MDNKILESKVLKKGYGKVSDLEQEIGEDSLRHLQLCGYVEHGISPSGDLTFKLTDKGREMLYYFGDRVGLLDRTFGFVLKYFLRFKTAY